MKFIGSVVTYLIFEFFIPACYTYTYRVCIVKMHCYFLEYYGASQSYWGPAKYNYEALPSPEGGGAGGSLGASLVPRGRGPL